MISMLDIQNRHGYPTWICMLDILLDIHHIHIHTYPKWISMLDIHNRHGYPTWISILDMNLDIHHVHIHTYPKVAMDIRDIQSVRLPDDDRESLRL